MCYLIEFEDKYWKLWPADGSWVETDSVGAMTGQMHHGSIANFCEKHIARNSFLPKNHSKKWTKEEKSQLQAYIVMDKSIPEIAKSMGRSRRSVVAKSADLLGVNLDYPVADDPAPVIG